MWSLRWHFTNKSVAGAPYSIKGYSYSLSHSWTLWWRVRWLKQCRLEVVAELQQWWRRTNRRWKSIPRSSSSHRQGSITQRGTYKETKTSATAGLGWTIMALAVSSLQPLQSGTLSLHLSVSVPVLILLSSPQDPLLPACLPIHLTPLLLRLRFGFCWPLCAFINYIYLLTYLVKRPSQLSCTAEVTAGSKSQKYS